jgi:hypothetical protein
MMNRNLLVLVTLLIGVSLSSFASDSSRQPSNGIAYPEGWREWATVTVSHRNDNHTLRVIVGNAIAVEAAKSGNTNPWPDGAILGKVVWKDAESESWPAATVPGEFVHAEFMFKDSAKYKETYGWGWARWLGMDQEPFDEGMESCIACHTPVKDQDWVFEGPAELPD